MDLLRFHYWRPGQVSSAFTSKLVSAGNGEAQKQKSQFPCWSYGKNGMLIREDWEKRCATSQYRTVARLLCVLSVFLSIMAANPLREGLKNLILMRPSVP